MADRCQDEKVRPISAHALSSIGYWSVPWQPVSTVQWKYQKIRKWQNKVVGPNSPQMGPATRRLLLSSIDWTVWISSCCRYPDGKGESWKEMSEKAKLTSHTLPDIRMVSSIWPSGYRTMTFLRRQGQGFPLLSEPLGDLRPSKAPSPPPPSQCASPATSLPLSPLPYHHHCLLLTHFPSFVPSASSFFSSPNPPPLTSYHFFLKLTEHLSPFPWSVWPWFNNHF